MSDSLQKKGFTLIETLIGILIVSIVMVGAFQALTAIGIGKVRLIQKTNTQKQSLYFSEKLFEMIKKGGTLDYEEYFNRKVVNSGYTPVTLYESGHYKKETGFGNYGGTTSISSIGTESYINSFYYCLGLPLDPDGCANAGGTPQSYGQYSFQFIDYNSNGDGDNGDEDGDGEIIGDTDDKDLGQGPDVFSLNSDTKELYLINGTKRGRTLFRYNVKLDPDAPPLATCVTTNNGATYTGTGCLGTIEYLVLDGRDWGMNHVDADSDSNSTEYDGVIDTWIINEQFSGNNNTVAQSYVDANNSYWQPLFPENINVTKFKVYPHPNIDLQRAWRESDDNQNVAEYVRIQLGMKPAWKDRKMLKSDPEEYNFSTTINLTNIFTQ